MWRFREMHFVFTAKNSGYNPRGWYSSFAFGYYQASGHSRFKRLAQFKALWNTVMMQVFHRAFIMWIH